MNPIDATPRGMALNDFGLTVDNAIAGLGLNTFGFMWPCDGIWYSAESPVTTTWVSCSIADDTVETCTD